MYNPASDESKGQAEWVEIINVSDQAILIEGWRLDDEDHLPFDQWGPFSCTLPPGGLAVIVNGGFVDEAQFRSAWDASDEDAPPAYQVIPVKWGGIANSPGSGNEVLRLLDGEGALVCETALDNGGNGWPKLTAAGGPSVYLTSFTDNPSDGRLWRASSTGVDGARECRPTPVFNGRDIGSPGTVPEALRPSRRSTASSPEVGRTDGGKAEGATGTSPAKQAAGSSAPASGDAPNKDAPNRDAPNRDAPNRDAPNRDAPNRDAPNRDAPNRDAPNREATPAR